jgi:hypothetical protein
MRCRFTSRGHNFQQWSSAGERRVIFHRGETARVGVGNNRWQRRDFGALLTLIGAHALLHRASRDRDQTGAIIATTADYAAVREPVANVFAEGIEATVQETVDAVAVLNKQEVSLGELAAKLALDKSSASRRLRDATDRGYRVSLETRRGRPARIVLGDPMPEMVKLAPEPGELGT